MDLISTKKKKKPISISYYFGSGIGFESTIQFTNSLLFEVECTTYKIYLIFKYHIFYILIKFGGNVNFIPNPNNKIKNSAT